METTVRMGGYTRGQLQRARKEQEFLTTLKDILKAGDADRLLAVLTAPKDDAIRRALESFNHYAAIAAANGDTRCLRIFQECGFALGDTVWTEAVEHGHTNCLAFAVSHGYKLKDNILETAVRNGHLACVEFLVQQGLPRHPYLHFVYPARPDQLKCIQLLLDKKVAVNPQTLIMAAGRGDLDFVRWLHQRGLPLWDQAQDKTIRKRKLPKQDPMSSEDRWVMLTHNNEVRRGTLYIPWDPHGPMWKALCYGAGHGAPINHSAKQLLEEKRRRTQAVPLCFNAAARLCHGPGCAEEIRVWAGMAALPSALVEELLIAADLEIPESVMRPPPLKAPAVAGCKGPQGCRDGEGKA